MVMIGIAIHTWSRPHKHVCKGLARPRPLERWLPVYMSSPRRMTSLPSVCLLFIAFSAFLVLLYIYLRLKAHRSFICTQLTTTALPLFCLPDSP